MPPSVGDVVIGSLAVAIACVGGVAALTAAVRGGNWFGYVCALGCAAFVAGVVGQRSYPAPGGTPSTAPGPWDAGVTIPLIGLHLTPVAVAGLLAAAVGLSLLLLFERVPDGAVVAPAPLPPLDEDDTV
ncbi:MAG: hypothetical protein JOY68_02640 [Candidatus Dormibacteraeota bacterium]|nr:hypothetical protein [Candidatus Dormibacteraeota bacterium]MBV8444345.1 hypothetical protein [Candidatus Dormibacteraeota bacterium]